MAIVLILSVFFGVGFFILGAGIRSYVKAQNARGWLSAQGTLQSNELIKSSGEDGSTFRVSVKYSYTVNGRAYEGDRIAFGYTGSSAYAGHAAIHQKLRGALTLKVLYNPSHPEESVLASGTSRSTLIMIVFGLTWLLFAAGFTALWTMASGEDEALLDRIIVLETEVETPGEVKGH